MLYGIDSYPRHTLGKPNPLATLRMVFRGQRHVLGRPFRGHISNRKAYIHIYP